MALIQDPLAGPFRKLEAKKERLMHLLLVLPTEAYLKQPSPQSWSIGQAANHLFLSETFSLAYLKKKMSYPDDLPPFHVKSWGSVLLTKLALNTPYKAKAPKTINMWENQPILLPDELNQKWSALRIELKNFLDGHHPTYGRHLVFRHPFAGRMTMRQMLIFFNDHMAHHIRQVQRIMRHSNLK